MSSEASPQPAPEAELQSSSNSIVDSKPVNASIQTQRTPIHETNIHQTPQIKGVHTYPVANNMKQQPVGFSTTEAHQTKAQTSAQPSTRNLAPTTKPAYADIREANWVVHDIMQVWIDEDAKIQPLNGV